MFTIRPPSTCRPIQSVNSPPLVSASWPKSCQRLCSVGRRRVLYTRGGSFEVVEAGGAGVVAAFCDGVMNGPPRVEALVGGPKGRWSRTSTIKQADVSWAPDAHTIIVFYPSQLEDIDNFRGYLFIANILEESLILDKNLRSRTFMGLLYENTPS